MDYILHIFILISIYGVLSISLDLLVGHTGLLSIAHGAFYGLGAYTSAILATKFAMPFFIAILIGITVSLVFSFIVSLPSLRLHDDYFIIVTFAFQTIVFSILNNWMDVTRGPLGISGITEPIIFGLAIQSRASFSVLAACVAVGSFFMVKRISRSPYGRVLRAIREDELLAEVSGKNVFRFKVSVFALSAAIAASAGSLYAHYITYIDPMNFTVMESILVITMVIIGGAGSLYGPFAGAALLVTLPELLRFIGLPSLVAANIRQMLYGGLLVCFIIWRPQGILGGYSFDEETPNK